MIHNLISMKHSTKNYCFGDHIIFRFIFNYFGKFPALAIKAVPGNLVDSGQNTPNFEFKLIRLYRSSWCQPFFPKPCTGYTLKFIKTMLSIYNIFSMHNNITNFGI